MHNHRLNRYTEFLELIDYQLRIEKILNEFDNKEKNWTSYASEFIEILNLELTNIKIRIEEMKQNSLLLELKAIVYEITNDNQIFEE